MVYTTASPTVHDVLCGKDKTYTKHPGNQIYRELIERMAESYGNEQSKQTKMQITKDIVNIMECDHNAKFLRKVDETYWEEITNQQARDKTSHALRFCSASLKKQQTKKSSSSVKKTKQRNSLPTTTTTTKTRKHHRRVISADSNATNNNNNGPKTAVSYHEVFQRQQQILYGSSFKMDEGTIDPVDFILPESISSSSSNNSLLSAHPPTLSSRVKSEELEAILREPIEQDWMDDDAFFSMT